MREGRRERGSEEQDEKLVHVHVQCTVCRGT